MVIENRLNNLIKKETLEQFKSNNEPFDEDEFAKAMNEPEV